MSENRDHVAELRALMVMWGGHFGDHWNLREHVEALIAERDAAIARAERAEAALARRTKERDRARELIRDNFLACFGTGVSREDIHAARDDDPPAK